LNHLKSQACDVIVTDMRMPGMDGAELLRRVQQRYPHIIRIILSGHAEFEALLKSAELAHQYLAKPCDVQVIQDTIQRVCAAGDHMQWPDIESVIGDLRSVPSMPQCYFELTRAMSCADTSLAHIAGIVSRDVGMTAKVLQLVNSAFFGLPRHLDTPLDAVKFLGVEVLRGLVVKAKVFSAFDAGVIEQLGLAGIERESVVAGSFARSVAADLKLDSSDRDAALVAGMLHDMGVLVLASNAPDRYSQALDMCKGNTPLCAAEKAVFGYDHTQVGAYLLTIWGLPHQVVDAVAYHHRPLTAAVPEVSALTAVHVAAGLLEAGRRDGYGGLDLEYIGQLKLEPRLEAWRGICTELLEAASA